MACVYILYSPYSDNYYTGSCDNLEIRLAQHQNKAFPNSFTSKNDDWQLFYKIEKLNYKQARNIETHIKNMKSSKYLVNLSKYPEISEKLISNLPHGYSEKEL